MKLTCLVCEYCYIYRRKFIDFKKKSIVKMVNLAWNSGLFVNNNLHFIEFIFILI